MPGAREQPARPRVVAWSHEQSEDFAPVVEPVCGSFGEFQSLLRPRDDGQQLVAARRLDAHSKGPCE